MLDKLAGVSPRDLRKTLLHSLGCAVAAGREHVGIEDMRLKATAGKRGSVFNISFRRLAIPCSNATSCPYEFDPETGMLWFFHPRPFNRREVAVQMVARKGEAAPSTEFVIVDYGPGGKPGLMQGDVLAADIAAPAVRFHVSYRLREYLSIVAEHVGYLDKKARRSRRFAPGLLPVLGCAVVAATAQLADAAWFAYTAMAGALLVGAFCLPFMVKPWVALLTTPIFLLKRWRMGSCGFTVGPEGIERVSALGNLTKNWRDVVAVHRYAQGYLLVFRTGAMQIPYRCLDAGQAQRLRALVAARPRQRLTPA